jgi:hypothetical protein
MELVKELKVEGFNIVPTNPIIHCWVCDDNSGTFSNYHGTLDATLSWAYQHLVPLLQKCDRANNHPFDHHQWSTDWHANQALNKTKLGQHHNFVMGQSGQVTYKWSTWVQCPDPINHSTQHMFRYIG